MTPAPCSSWSRWSSQRRVSDPRGEGWRGRGAGGPGPSARPDPPGRRSARAPRNDCLRGLPPAPRPRGHPRDPRPPPGPPRRQGKCRRGLPFRLRRHHHQADRSTTSCCPRSGACWATDGEGGAGNVHQERRRGAGKLRLQGPRGHAALRPGPAERKREAPPPGGVPGEREEPRARREAHPPGKDALAARGARPHLPRAERSAPPARRGGGRQPALLPPVLFGRAAEQQPGEPVRRELSSSTAPWTAARCSRPSRRSSST